MLLSSFPFYLHAKLSGFCSISSEFFSQCMLPMKKLHSQVSIYENQLRDENAYGNINTQRYFLLQPESFLPCLLVLGTNFHIIFYELFVFQSQSVRQELCPAQLSMNLTSAERCKFTAISCFILWCFEHCHRQSVQNSSDHLTGFYIFLPSFFTVQMSPACLRYFSHYDSHMLQLRVQQPVSRCTHFSPCSLKT